MKRITVICHDVPYPPTHGGRVDMWNRIIALKKLERKIQVFYWCKSNEVPGHESVQAMRRVCDDVFEIKRSYRPRDFLHLRYPPRLLSFMPGDEAVGEAIVRSKAFGTEMLLLDGWHGFLLARRLAEQNLQKVVYRSHNIEHLLYQSVADGSSGMAKIVPALYARRLRRTEEEIRDSVDYILDICQEDNNYWKGVGETTPSSVLPPTWLEGDKSQGGLVKKDIDIVYAGNLWAPHNVQGLEWFFLGVLPRLRSLALRPLRIAVAGSHPSPRVQSLCSESSVECIANPESLLRLYERARVAINPNVRGAGMNLKMIDILSAGIPVITTTLGVRGLPNDLARLCSVADTEEGFANEILSAMESDNSGMNGGERSSAIESYFGITRLAGVLDTLESQWNITSKQKA